MFTSKSLWTRNNISADSSSLLGDLGHLNFAHFTGVIDPFGNAAYHLFLVFVRRYLGAFYTS
jgi:hypothetical protein